MNLVLMFTFVAVLNLVRIRPVIGNQKEMLEAFAHRSFGWSGFSEFHYTPIV